MKPFLEMSDEEKIKSCDRMMNVLTHNDWQEVYFLFSEASNGFRQEMENAPNWDAFLVSRTKYEYIRDNILSLPDNIRNIREELSKAPESLTNIYED